MVVVRYPYQSSENLIPFKLYLPLYKYVATSSIFDRKLQYQDHMSNFQQCFWDMDMRIKSSDGCLI